MRSIAISDFKTQCLTLLETVARTGEPLLVTKRGKPLARVMSSGDSAAACPQDTLHGSVEILGDLLAPVVPPDAWNAVRGVLLSQEDARSSQRRAQRPRRSRGAKKKPNR